MNVKLFAYVLIFVSLFLFACNGCGEKGEEQIQTVEQLLESKHRLEYNDDGSFRVMTVSDTHMNVEADEDEVQGISNRIKTWLDFDDEIDDIPVESNEKNTDINGEKSSNWSLIDTGYENYNAFLANAINF